MNKKFLLSTVFMLMSWQGIFAGAPEFLGTPEGPVKPRVSMTEQPQGHLVGNMIPDTMGRILVNLPFKDGWVFLSAKKTHRNHGEVWEIFGGIHGISLTKDEDAAEKIRGKIIAQSQETLLAAVPSEYDSLTPDIMINLLENAQEKPFLWGVLVDTLQKKIYIGDEVPPSWWAQFGSVCSLEDEKAFNGHAEAGSRMFEGVSVPLRIVFLETVAKKVCPSDDTWPAPGARDAQGRLIDAAIEGRGLLKEISREKRLAYLENAAEYKNPKRQSTPYAKNVQERLIRAADGGEGLFAGISRDERLAYLENTTKSRDSEGKPTPYAQNVQERLIMAANWGEGAFAGISREERLAYLENTTKSRDSEGKPTPYAKKAQDILISSADRGKGLFAGISREERLAYLENTTKNRDSEGEPTPYAQHAQDTLISSAYSGEGVFAESSREERLAFLESIAAMGVNSKGNYNVVVSIMKITHAAEHGIGLFAESSREERLAYVKKKSEQGILRGMFAEVALKNLQ